MHFCVSFNVITLQRLDGNQNECEMVKNLKRKNRRVPNTICGHKLINNIIIILYTSRPSVESTLQMNNIVRT